MGFTDDKYVEFFAPIGVLSVAYVAFKALYTLWGWFKSYVLSAALAVDVKSLGQWAGMLIGVGQRCPIQVPRFC